MAAANNGSRMRIVRASLLAAAVCLCARLSAQTPANSTGPSFLVERGRAGAFQIGMTVDEAQAIAGIEHTKLAAKYPEGMFEPELNIWLSGFAGRPAISAPISDFPCGMPALSGLLVRDPRFRTSHGIHAGSTLADIRKYAPSAKISNFDADGFPGVFDAEPGVSIVFEGATRSINSARVTALWVHSGPNVKSRRCPGDDDWAAVYQEVLRAVVMPQYARFGNDAPPLVVVSETTHMCDASFKALPGVGCIDRSRTSAPFLTGELARDFFGRNSGRYQVPMLDGASALVAAAAMPRLSPATAPRFNVTFSSPGFDHGRAAVYIGYSCGNLCGEGMLVLLELRDDKWKVASVQPLWVS
jgi:hypothetical protein